MAALDEALKYGKKLADGNLGSNKAINSLASGYSAIAKGIQGGGTKSAFVDGFNDTFRKQTKSASERMSENIGRNVTKKTPGINAAKKATETIKPGQGDLQFGKIAGGYMGLSAGARVLSGGGITRDKNGNNNLIGVPFI